MSPSLQQFRKNVESLNSLTIIYDYLNEHRLGDVIELDKVLRAQYVLLVSAFDFYVHDVVRSGMIETLEGEREQSKAFEKFSIPLKYIQAIMRSDSLESKKAFVSKAIKEVTEKDSYQAPQNVERALSLIAVSKIWSTIANDLAMPANDIKRRLNLIVNRRNQIAHEADYDTLKAAKRSMSQEDMSDTLQFVTNVVEAIDRAVFG